MEANQTEQEWPDAGLVMDMVQAAATARPEAIALVEADGEEWSYGRLEAESNRLARWLRKRGVGPETIVGVRLERSARQVMALLGVLKAGGAYLPLDPDLPEQRIAYMLEDAGARLVITEEAIEEAAGESGEALPHHALPDNLAYVIYTSGSTGKPKGVMVSHANFANQIHWVKEQFQFGPTDRVLYKASASFDASLLEHLVPLALGCTVAIVPPGRQYDVEYLVQFLEEQRITYVDFGPALLNALLQRTELPSLNDLER